MYYAAMGKYKHLLFDVDGTLLDTEELIVRSFQETVRHFGGGEISRETIITNMGIPLDPQIKLFLGEKSAEDVRKIREYYVAFQRAIFQDYLSAFSGVEGSLEKLKQSGVSLAIVTSRLRPSLETYLEFCKIDRYFQVIVTPEVTVKHKPHPEPVLAAMEMLKARPEETVFVGDAVFDMEAGRAAGVDTVFAGWGPNHVDDLPFPPTHAFNDFSELMNLLN